MCTRISIYEGTVPNRNIWNRKAMAISLENRATVQITGGGNDWNLTSFNHTGRWWRPYAKSSNFIDLRYLGRPSDIDQ